MYTLYWEGGGRESQVGSIPCGGFKVIADISPYLMRWLDLFLFVIWCKMVVLVMISPSCYIWFIYSHFFKSNWHFGTICLVQAAPQQQQSSFTTPEGGFSFLAHSAVLSDSRAATFTVSLSHGNTCNSCWNVSILTKAVDCDCVFYVHGTGIYLFSFFHFKVKLSRLRENVSLPYCCIWCKKGRLSGSLERLCMRLA